MARAIHQLIAQPRVPDIAGSQMRSLAQMEQIKGQRLQNEVASKQLANFDQSRVQEAKTRALEQAVQMRAGGADDATVLGYLNEVGAQYGLPEADPQVLPRIDALAKAKMGPEKPEDLVQVYDPETRTMRFVPKSQASGRVAQAPKEPKPEDLVEVYDPATKTMRFAPKSQAAGMASEAPKAPPKPADDLTPAQKKVDEAFAQDYNDLIAQGGLSDIEKQLSQLREAKATLDRVAGQGFFESLLPAALGGQPNISGAGVGIVPDFMRAMTSGGAEAIAVREAVEEVVQRNLRLVLGAQFTQKEGDRLISRAFNPNLPEEENAKRVGRLVEQIQSAADSKMAAAQYYEENGTLRGFEGKTQFTIDDFDPTGGTGTAGYPDGTVAEGPDGERMVVRNGEWVPLEEAIGGRD